MSGSVPTMLRDAPPEAPQPTDYDWAHRVAYLRLLDAAADGADWREVATLVLGLDAAMDHDRAKAICSAHLARAIWMRDHGYRGYLESPDRSAPG